MITFLSLFLGLVTGVQQVELAVGTGVAAVELRLDGEVIERLDEGGADGTWTAAVDLGPELAPHALEAVAYDGEGYELERIVQRINLPRQPAEARIVVDRPERGPAVARLSWESIVARSPESIRVTFDGEELDAEDPDHIELPPHDLEEFHFLRAELAFAENVLSTAEVSFGGGALGETISTDLTAVPLAPAEGADPPDLKALEGRLHLTDGTPLEVAAVEAGPAEVVIVPEEGVRAGLIALWPGSRIRRGRRAGLLAALKKDQRARFLWPVTTRRESRGLAYDIFPPSETFTHEDGGIYWFLTQGRFSLPDKGQRIADAVAVAANLAAAANHRRAVVLMLSGPEDDASVHHPVAVRRYLARLHVPLYVWRVPPANDEPVPAESAWGEGESVDSLRAMRRAAARLAEDLERQRIAWVDGTHLPQAVEVAPGTPTLTTAGAPLATLPEVPPDPTLASSERMAGPAGSGLPGARASRERSSESPFLDVDPGDSGAEAALLRKLAAEIDGESADPATETAVGEASTPEETLRVEAGTLLRTTPEPGASGLAVVDAHGDYGVLERRNGWVKIRYRSLAGWVQPEPRTGQGVSATGFDVERAQGRVGRAQSLLGRDARELSFGPWTLLTDVDRDGLLERLRAVAGHLEAAYRRRFGLAPGPPVPGSPETVLLFAAEETFRRYEGVEGEVAELGLAGHADEGVAALFVGDREAEAVTAVLVHELVHLLNRRTFPDAIPPWLEEGMADDLAYCRIERDGELVLGSLGGRKLLSTTGVRRSIRGLEVTQRLELGGGRAALERVTTALEAGRLPTLDHLLGLSWREFVEPEERSLHYPHAAFFLRYLMAGEHRDGAQAFLGALDGGSPPRLGALLAFLGTDLPRLESRFRSWLRTEARRAERMP